MADILSAVTASNSATGGSAPVLTVIQVAIADLSQALASLNRSIQTSATVTAPPVGNTLTLSTALGDITVALPQQLNAAEQQSLLQQLAALAQAQRPLTIGLQAGSPPTQAVLLLPATSPTAALQNAATPQNPIIPLPLVQAGEDLPALVLPSNVPAPANTGTLASQIPLADTVQANTAAAIDIPVTDIPATEPQPALAAPQAGNAVTAQASPPQPTVTSAAPENLAPQSPPVAAPLSQAVSQTGPSLPAPSQNLSLPAPASQPVAVAPASLATLLQPGNEITLHVDAVLPPLPQNMAIPPLAANQIAATVTGTGTDGQMILKAGDATLFVKAQVTAPAGSTVIVTVEAAKAATLITLPSTLPVNFPALPQALAALAQLDPQALQQMIAMHLPQPTDALPGALLFLFSAFRQGNVRGWLGNAATDSLIQMGKAELIDSLSRELGGAGQTAQDNVVGDWRTYPIPLYAQQQFQALTLYVHNERQGRDESKEQANSGNAKVRFVIDMRLSKLFRPRQLDMILRSESVLPHGMHNDLRGAYIKAMGAVGYAGSINFQVGRKHWLTMQRQTPPGIVT
jgi:hypothetical protein